MERRAEHVDHQTEGSLRGTSARIAQGADLHDVEANQFYLGGDAHHEVVNLGEVESTRFERSGAGGERGIHGVDVEGDVNISSGGNLGKDPGDAAAAQFLGRDDLRVQLAGIAHGLGIIGQAAHADLDNFRDMRKLSGAQNPRRVIEVARCAIPGVEVRVNVDEGERPVEGAQRRVGDAVIAANHNGERLVGEDGLHRGRDFVVRLRGDGGHDCNIADIGPALAFEHSAVAVDVVEAFGQIVVIFLRGFAHVARSVAFAGLSPGAFVERYAEDGEVGVELFEVGDVRSS